MYSSTFKCPQKESFQMYECYCQNKPRSDALWRQFSDCQFFQVSFEIVCVCNYYKTYLMLTDGCNPLSYEGMPKKAGAQTGPGFLSTETSSTPH